MFREIEDIVQTLNNVKERGKKCSVLIGAGCSVSAGIPTAQGFVDIIKEKYSRDYDRADEKTYPKCMSKLSPDEQRSLIIDYVDKVTCPPKTDPTNELGLDKGDRQKWRRNISRPNRSSASCGKRRC